MTAPASVLLRDVTLRDGLQDEAPVPTATKVALFEALTAAGVRELELTSFVRPDRVPAMADADALVAATAGSDVVRWGLVLNVRGAERALAAGLRHLQFVLSASERHNVENAGRTVAESLSTLAAAVAAARRAGAAVEVTVATAFGCPYEGPVPVDAVLGVVERCLAAGVDGISLADTIGTAVPGEVAALVTAVRGMVGGDVPVGAHLHDTRGLGVANALAAIDAGVDRLDAAVGALGGCPFAPGASGNVALEDLAHVLEESGVATGLDVEGLVEAARLACDAVGRPVGSHVGVAGPRFAPAAKGSAG